MHRPGVSLYIPLLALLECFPGAAATPDTPADFQVHPELELNLFAQEPDVVDPVALCFDSAGRMFVVEMRDFPYGLPPDNRPGGTLRLLEDRDADGRADRSVLFAEDLSFPTSIAPWRDGVIVLAPPEILFLQDTNHDGRADVREVLFRGLALAVTDGNASGLRWGLDNFLHGVNGGHGGSVTSARKPGPPLSLADLDFRFQPDTGEIQTTYATGGGFGLVFDEWGRSFTPHNINHLQMRILPARQLRRFPGLRPIDGTVSISDHGEMARIYPISEARTRPNHPEQAGYFSSAGGVGFIGHPIYPADLAGSAIVCDVVGNLVHRDRLLEDGPILVARRSSRETQSEFLAGRDPAFRPLGLEPGPDGALYLPDMQRDVIEHPDYIPASMRDKLDLRAGEDRGRIYRLGPKSGLPSEPSLASLSPIGLAEALGSRNPWRRITAQRLLVEQRSTAVVPQLESIATRGSSPQARVHALWTLEGLNALTDTTLAASLRDPDARIRENAVQISEQRLSASPVVQAAVLACAADPAPRVRFLTAGALGVLDNPETRSALFSLFRQDSRYAWSRIAVLSSLRSDETDLLLHLLGDTRWTKEPANSPAEALRDVADLAGARLTSASAASLPALTEALQRIGSEDLILAVLEGLESGLARRGSRPVAAQAFASVFEPLVRGASRSRQKAVWSLERALGLPASTSRRQAIDQAADTALASGAPLAERVLAIELLTLADSDRAAAVLLDCFQGLEPEPVQSAALSVLSQPTRVGIAQGLLDRWQGIHPNLKRAVVLLCLRKRDYHAPLLDAVESGRIRLGELNLDLEDRRRLVRWSTPEIQTRARLLIGDGEYGNRQAKVEEWLTRLPQTGDADRGRKAFESVCAQCHRAGTLGHDVGPNLTALSHRSVEDLVSNILDPNMAINPAYRAVTVERTDGEILSGLLGAETDDAITLHQAQGLRTTLSRDQITAFESSGASLMPEGLETGMTPQDLRDLVAFLQRIDP